MYSADFNNNLLTMEPKSAVYRWPIGSHGTLAYNPHKYPFIHLGEEEQRGMNVLLKKSDGMCVIRTRDPSIPSPESYH